MPKALPSSSRIENLPNPMVGLLTDFGLLEPYVAQMKGVILKHAPNIQFIDITHNVPAFKVRLGAHFLAETVQFFPPNSTFLCVVDPEVGSSRDLLALQNDGHTFFAPNNGLLSLIPRQPDVKLWKLKFEAGQEGVKIFAGRDVLSLALGRFLSGESLQNIGSPMDITELVIPHWPVANLAGGKVKSKALHIDNFGNVLLNISTRQWNRLDKGKITLLKFMGNEYPLFSANYYSQVPENTLALIAGSQGFMEIAMNQASAANYLNFTFEMMGTAMFSIVL